MLALLQCIVWSGVKPVLLCERLGAGKIAVASLITEWEAIGLTTPMSVSIWMRKGFASPGAVVRFRNGEAVEPMELTAPGNRQKIKKGGQRSTPQSSSDRKKREWLRNSQIEALVTSGVDLAQAEEWIFAGYSSDEARSWLKVDGIQLPDDLAVWLDIGINSPEALQAWYAKGLTSADAVQKQLEFEKSEQIKFSRLGITPDRVTAWKKIGAWTFNQVNYLIKRGYSIEILRRWMAAGFTTLEDIEAWRATGLGVAESKQWRASGFLAEEIDEIVANKFSLAEVIAWQQLLGGAYSKRVGQISRWRKAGFTPATAGQWMSSHKGITAKTAAHWRDNGYQPESDWILLETTPEMVGPWRNSKQSPAQVLLWIKSGFDKRTAQRWFDKGIRAQQARVWRNHGYTPSDAKVWIDQGVQSPRRSKRLKKITVDVSEYFVKGVTYNAFRKTAKLLNVHKLAEKFSSEMSENNRSSAHFDTLTPFAKCMTAYAIKNSLSDSAVMDIEDAHFYQTDMVQPTAKKFMQRYSNSCEDWTQYIFSIWFKHGR